MESLEHDGVRCDQCSSMEGCGITRSSMECSGISVIVWRAVGSMWHAAVNCDQSNSMVRWGINGTWWCAMWSVSQYGEMWDHENMVESNVISVAVWWDVGSPEHGGEQYDQCRSMRCGITRTSSAMWSVYQYGEMWDHYNKEWNMISVAVWTDMGLIEHDGMQCDQCSSMVRCEITRT